MILVCEHPNWTDERIANEVGVHKGTVSRNRFYEAAASRARAKYVRRGRRTDSGDIEVVAD